MRESLVAADSISIHTLTARTALLREVGLNVLEKTFYEDYEYISKATLFARSIEFVDLAVYHYLLQRLPERGRRRLRATLGRPHARDV